jgi:PhnB protein
MAVPYLIVNNAAKAIDFYREVFGASELVRLSAPDGKIAHAELMFAEGRIMLADEYPDMGYKSPTSLSGSPVSIYLTVPDVDATYANVISSGGTSMMAVADQFDGDRRGTVVDPFGHIWLIATKKEAVSYEEMASRFLALMQAEGGA